MLGGWGGDTLLGRFDNLSALAVGESYANQAHFTIPMIFAGNVFILIRTDDLNVAPVVDLESTIVR